MKILNTAQIRAADLYTIAHEPISSIDLMDRAASCCIPVITNLSTSACDYMIVCGMGNNGGDGLAIARLLHGLGRSFQVWIIHHRAVGSADFQVQLSRLRLLCPDTITEISDISDFNPHFTSDTIAIDAMLGTGIDRTVSGLLASVIEYINRHAHSVISIDIPSGLNADDIPLPGASIIRARHTITFQQPKLSFMMQECDPFVGDLHIVDIGIDLRFIADQPGTYYYTTDADIRPLLLQRHRYSHKGTFGHSLIIAGSFGRMGAAVLAAKSCIHSGTGLLTMYIPRCGYDIIQISVPEAMASCSDTDYYIDSIPALDAYQSIGVGPGLGTDPSTAYALKHLIQSAPCPLVLDADALNILAKERTWLAFLPEGSVLTPHPKEMDRLTHTHHSSMDRLHSARQLAQKHRIYIALKGARTAVVCPDGEVWLNSSGNPAMARGGSGDVLTGILTALIARGYSPADATLLGVYIHGLAADIAVQSIHPEAMSASLLVDHLSSAWQHIYNNS